MIQRPTGFVWNNCAQGPSCRSCPRIDFPEWVVKNDNGIIKPFNNTAVNSPFAYLPSLIIQGDYKASSIATLLITSGIIALAIWLAREF